MLAERQTGGRGRRGRQWASPLAAHIYLSMARRFSGGLAQLAGLSLAVGVAASEALHAAGFSGVGLKWPNDLLADERKLGGLLIEGGGELGGPARAVIGLGVNVHMPDAFAATIGQPWVDLDTLAGTPVSRNAIVATLLSHLLPALALFEAQGLAPFLPRYAALDLLAGHKVRVEEAGRLHEGIALGLAEDGALRGARRRRRAPFPCRRSQREAGMSQWLFDLGNSRFKFAPLRDDGRAGDVQAWAHGVQTLSAEAAAALPTGDIAWVASVASPALTADIVGHLGQRFAEVRVAHTLSECAGVRVAYAEPQRFGVDRFLALLGARALGHVLVAGVGTALTIDLMDADGGHRGGRIAALAHDHARGLAPTRARNCRPAAATTPNSPMTLPTPRLPAAMAPPWR